MRRCFCDAKKHGAKWHLFIFDLWLPIQVAAVSICRLANALQHGSQEGCMWNHAEAASMANQTFPQAETENLSGPEKTRTF